MMFVFVPLTRGRVITSSLPTAPHVEQPRALSTLTEVTPSLLFEILNPLKLKLGKKGKSVGYLTQEATGVKAYRNNYDVLLRKRA